MIRTTNTKIAVAERNSGIDRHVRMLSDIGHNLVGAVSSTDELYPIIDEHRPDVVLLDLELTGSDDVFTAGFRLLALGTAVIYIVDGADRELLDKARAVDPLGYIVEPVDIHQLELCIDTALSLRDRRHQLASHWADGPLSESIENMSYIEADELNRRTQLAETVFNAIPDGLIITDQEGNYIAVNESAFRIVGPYGVVNDIERRAESYGLYLEDGETLVPTDQLPVKRALSGEPVVDSLMVLRNSLLPDGRLLSASAHPLRDKEGELTGAVMHFRDVTRVKRAEEELHKKTNELVEQTEILTEVLDTISDGIIVADDEGNFRVWNPSAERMVGLGASDTSPDEWSDHYGVYYADAKTLMPPEELPLARAIAGDSIDEMEVFVRNQFNPEGTYLSVNGRPMVDPDGNSRGGVVMFRDVTAQHRRNEALSRAFAQGRLEVLDTLMHNIGNAVNSVSVGVGTIATKLRDDTLLQRLSALAQALDEHSEDLAGYIEEHPQGKRVLHFLSALVKDFDYESESLLSTVDRVESRIGHIVDIIRTQRSSSDGGIVKKDSPLVETISEAVNLVQESLTRRDIVVTVDCDEAPQYVRVEESQFSQMIVNLVRNAIEAIDERRRLDEESFAAFLRIACRERNEWLEIDVIDNGIGIESTHFKTIFAPGYTTKIGGTGLGLHAIGNYIIGSGGRVEPLSAGRFKGTTMRVSMRMEGVAVFSEATVAELGS